MAKNAVRCIGLRNALHLSAQRAASAIAPQCIFLCNAEPQAWEFYAVTDYDEVATSISGTDEQVQVKAIYSVNGTVQRGMKKGVNIVKMSDGSVKKVLVK